MFLQDGVAGVVRDSSHPDPAVAQPVRPGHRPGWGDYGEAAPSGRPAGPADPAHAPLTRQGSGQFIGGLDVLWLSLS